MITHKMTPSEVYKEVLRDRREVLDFLYTKVKPFSKRVSKATVFPVRAHADYVSTTRNNWLVLFTAFSKKNRGDNVLFFFPALCSACQSG